MFYKKNVAEHECSSCVLRQPLLSLKPCKKRPPEDPEFSQPSYGEAGEICYDKASKVPKSPEGYQRREESNYTFDPIWPLCPYRLFNNDLAPDGELKINAYCAALGQKVSLENCQKCVVDVETMGGSLDLQQVPDFPSIGIQLQTYAEAVAEWIVAGRPKRDDEYVKNIHKNYCSKCNWYDKDSKKCRGCGCKVKAKGGALLNKIRMATQHCPRGFW
jgi:hypothetical protein